jgi:hypothetical protein
MQIYSEVGSPGYTGSYLTFRANVLSATRNYTDRHGEESERRQVTTIVRTGGIPIYAQIHLPSGGPDSVPEPCYLGMRPPVSVRDLGCASAACHHVVQHPETDASD